MEFRILGPLEVVESGRTLDLGGAKQRTLLAMLVLEANKVVSSDRLTDALWESQQPETAQKALQVYVSQLRKALGKDRLLTKTSGYVLRVEEGELDVERFDRLVEEGGADRLREALSLWRGPPLADFTYERFARGEIARLEELRLEALEKRLEADLAAGRHAALVGELDALVQAHPLRERLRSLLMLALYRSGRQAEALAAYQDARSVLVDELGIEPTPALRELETAILRQDPALDVSVKAEPAKTEAAAVERPLAEQSPPGHERKLAWTSEIGVLGRNEELAVLGKFLQAVDRLPAALVIEGEAGIGKTTLWRAAIGYAADRGYCVLSTRPAQAESQISYAGLADLLERAHEEALAGLPQPQRHALEVALLLRDAGGGGPDQTAIAFGFLGALRAAAREQPLLVAVDDLQWLDAPSSFALRFAARRLRSEPVGFLLAIRAVQAVEPPLGLGGLLAEERTSGIQVGPLSLGALQHLIQSRLGVVPLRSALQRLHQTSGGNPFFALELARALREGGDRLDPGGRFPAGSELRQLLRTRLAVLPSESEEALLVAAAVPQPTVTLVAEAVGQDPLPSLRLGGDAGLVELDGDRIRFTHPLFASAVYTEAPVELRREIHRRLATIVADPEERARHLALGAKGPDAGVASALDEAARVARTRGAPQAAAELSELAVRLTPQPEAEAADRRRLEAGAAHFESGDTATARALFVETAETARAGSLRAEALSRLARVHHYAGDQRVAVELFRECLANPDADASIRADAADGLATSLFFLREELPDALSHARSAARTAEEEGNRAGLAVALGTQGMIEAVLGRREAATTLESAVALEEWARGVPLVRQPSFQLAVARVWIDDLDSARAGLEGVRQQAVAQGDESSLPFVLAYLGLAECLSGRWPEAMRAAEEGEQVALAAGQEIGRAFALSVRALVAACLGREEGARADADEAIVLAERGTMFATMTSLWAHALLDLSLARPADAHRRLGPLVERVASAGIGEPGSVRFVTDDVEALVAVGELDAAAIELERFEKQARRLGRRSVLAAVYRCRGLLAAASGSPGEALPQFHRALDDLERLPLPLERARTLLALGSTQRQTRQRRAARETLEAALRLFDELGASLWAERTRAELGRISGRAPSSGELTPTERRVAELVAQGRTNREVAAVLYVTPRTVEGTLSRVYAKLGLRSRAELARHWASRPD